MATGTAKNIPNTPKYAPPIVTANITKSGLIDNELPKILGFIIFAIPLVVKEEKEVLKGRYKNIVWLLIGVIFVTAITLVSTKTSFDINLETLNIGTAIYIFVVAAVAISAMILPGISGSNKTTLITYYTSFL